jgi:hypothetical protein
MPEQPNPMQPQPVPTQKLIKGPCQVCQKEMTFVMPTPRIFNEIDVSVLAIAHPPSRCRECQAIHMPIIAGLGEEGELQISWKPVKVQHAPMVVSGNESTLRQAIEQAQFSDKIKRGN